MARAATTTSAAARATLFARRRVTGDEMPTEATMLPSGSRIGAATQVTSAMYSPSSNANPSARARSQVRASFETDVTVVRV